MPVRTAILRDERSRYKTHVSESLFRVLHMSRELSQTSLKDRAFQRTYETGESNFARDFYGPCLRASVLFCQAAGFFRSSLLRVMGSDLTTFVKRGGKIRLIVSPDLTPEDIRDLEEGYA